ncbi:TetR family transcriptional regulator [Salsuginibacillus halophilus]|uniref:TetR family transcriptional regulator n=1 Tax=Salsuginibacillus halophilus TaxID=517424 RepID=A0A2P8HCT2_9BACI|nr:TetR/AcrR family transcriptional regulator [Salsuginibacillus halophilus]PSL44035.1 TetR family transcriptional regulator [Salsuginibacillus halophilus]
MSKRNSLKYNQIIDAAVTVIAENGYHNAQVSKIAKEAGVADGTIYLYFKNKEDLLVSLFEVKMGQFVDTITTELERLPDVEDQLRALVRLHFQQLNADPELAVVTQLELRQSNSALRSQINEVLKGYLQVVEEMIVTGKQEQVFSDVINEKLGRQMVFGTLDEVVTNWVMKDCRYDLMELVEPVHELLLNGFKGNQSER